MGLQARVDVTDAALRFPSYCEYDYPEIGDCGAGAAHAAIRSHLQKHRVLSAEEMSTYGTTLDFLKRNIANVIESEFFPDHASGATIDRILSQDVQCPSFANSSLDLITSSHVFEHVPDDVLGYSECHPILRQNGTLIFSIPLHDLPKTERLAEMVEGATVLLREPEYHHSRRGGANSSLTFWHHSVHDIRNRVASAGFDVRLVDVFIALSQHIPTKVVYAVKN